MGLDWQPLGKPKAGQEAEFEVLYERMCGPEDREPTLLKRMWEIAISPYETLAAPRVGSDARADRWAMDRYPKRPWKKLFVSRRKFMRVFQGYYVLDLVPPNDGLPVYTNGGPGSYCDIFAFRAQFFVDCADMLGGELLGEAYLHHQPAELTAYGTRLRARAVTYAAEHRVTVVLGQRDVPEEADDLAHPAAQAHVVDSAGRWCLFWGERGHGMLADY
jgi:hypothetical protein